MFDDETATGTTLLRLAEQHATGVLLGDAGAVYLLDGEVVHAESPASPTLDVLLAAAGRLSPESWQDAVDQAGRHHQVGRFLVEQGRLAEGELEICHLGALFDAAYFALGPGAGQLRFRHGAAHWLGPIRPVSARTVARESRRRRELLDQVCPQPRLDVSPVARRCGSTATASCSARQQALLDLADGVRTPCTIAHLLGRPAYHVLVDVRRLAAAGLIGTPYDEEPLKPTPLPTWLGHAATAEEPDVALLRRLRDLLEARL
ncbi:transcriptional regulator [Yinghuangia soli]|uniref:Transcriptional regulator n=1 Tax=Yinghuangia soli TaxID=2908204 RepID=A0AA41TZ07_9ACTN|nr:transcriptional regulator [Yinghuangia soli]MCF2528343.1 transcriptional regulator [Yinghuangia soli]